MVASVIAGQSRRPSAPDDVTGPINLGNPVETTVGELAERIVAMTNSPSAITYRPLPTDDPVQRCPDIGRARAKLGWEPKVPLEIGLGRTIAYFDRLLTHSAEIDLRASA